MNRVRWTTTTQHKQRLSYSQKNLLIYLADNSQAEDMSNVIEAMLAVVSKEGFPESRT